MTGLVDWPYGHSFTRLAFFFGRKKKDSEDYCQSKARNKVLNDCFQNDFELTFRESFRVEFTLMLSFGGFNE